MRVVAQASRYDADGMHVVNVDGKVYPDGLSVVLPDGEYKVEHVSAEVKFGELYFAFEVKAYGMVQPPIPHPEVEDSKSDSNEGKEDAEEKV